MRVAGFTSTGSKRPDILFGRADTDAPQRMVSSNGCRVTADDGREYLDCIMALGAVALGYGHPAVSQAAIAAIGQGGIGPLSPVLEESVAAQIITAMPHLEQLRFLKTGAEAAAAAVRLARVATGRERVLGCGYHGWLDWCNSAGGVPQTTRALYDTIPFNDVERSVSSIRAWGPSLACVMIEPVIEAEPTREWLAAIRDACLDVGALLVFDEIKTAFRVSRGGAVARWGIRPDLTVLGKALANGFPLAAVGGSRDVMHHVNDTWISSTMATEWISMAAASASLRVMQEQDVPDHLHRVGQALLDGLEKLAESHPAVVESVSGIAEMCHLRYHTEEMSQVVAMQCAQRGLLFKRSAYNFVSLAHGTAEVQQVLQILDDVLREQATKPSSSGY